MLWQNKRMNVHCIVEQTKASGVGLRFIHPSVVSSSKKKLDVVVKCFCGLCKSVVKWYLVEVGKCIQPNIVPVNDAMLHSDHNKD